MSQHIESLSDVVGKIQFSQKFSDIIEKYNIPIKVFDSWAVKHSDILGDNPNKDKVELSQGFKNPGEGMIYLRVITKLIDVLGVKGLLDLGCGASLPTLRAVLDHSPIKNFKVVAVDIDIEAVETSKNNATVLDVVHRYSFINADLVTLLESYELPAGYGVISNPPFAPVPTDVKDVFLLPISAGTDGLKFLGPILSFAKKNQAPVAFLASSLTSPYKLFELLEKDFNIVYIEGTIVPFGKYTLHPLVFDYLTKLKNEDKVDFIKLKDGRSAFMTLGVVVKPRNEK